MVNYEKLLEDPHLQFTNSAIHEAAGSCTPGRNDVQRMFSHSQPMEIFSFLQGTASNYGAGGFVNSAVGCVSK